MQTTDVYHKIIAHLDALGITYEHYTHEHIVTSADAARVRGTKLEEAAKALVLQLGSGRLVQCVVNGHRRIDLKKVKLLLGEKNVALAAPDLVLKETGCTVGSVPPFGNLFTPPMPVYADENIFSRGHVVFSVATHYHSIRMRTEDWKRAAEPVVVDIGKDAPQSS